MTKTISRKMLLEVYFLVQLVYMERVGFTTCTAASHWRAIKEPAASLPRMSEMHPVRALMNSIVFLYQDIIKHYLVLGRS